MSYHVRAVPERIVCLTEEPTEILYALGQQDRWSEALGHAFEQATAASGGADVVIANADLIDPAYLDVVKRFRDDHAAHAATVEQLTAAIGAALVQRVGAFGAEGAFATLEIDHRKTTLAIHQDLLRTGRQAVSATGTVGHEVGPGEGPGQPCLGLGRTQSASKQTTA